MFGQSDDENLPGCTRGDWGPNFCTCPSCSQERQEQERKSAASDAQHRAQGFDPHESGMPLMLWISDTNSMKLQRLARARRMEPETCAAKLLADVLSKL